MPEIHEQLTTALADRYGIERQIGAGGMAVVYLARDLKHDRKVALKVLNPDLGVVLGADRFLSEIRVTANRATPPHKDRHRRAEPALSKPRSTRLSARAGIVAALFACVATPTRAQCPDGSPPPCRSSAARLTTPAHSIAVLSFQARSRDTSDIFLAEGLADDIASRLGQLDRLIVRSREAVRRVRNADSMSVRQLGQTLNAAYVLSGSMRASGGQMHFVFELTRAQTGGVAWSSMFDRERNQLLELQGAVAEGAARAVLRELAERERRALGASSAHSEKAFAHVARGTAFLARRGQLLSSAVQEFRAAADDDPASAVAWSRLAQAYALCVFWSTCPGPADSLRLRARAAADRALALDSALADAWLADALSRSVSPVTLPDFPRAIASLRKARALEPRNVEVVHQMGTLLLFSGLDDDEAIRSARAALAMDPGRGVTYLVLSRIAFAQSRYHDALVLLDTVEAFEPQWASISDRWDAIFAIGDTIQMRAACARMPMTYRLQASDNIVAQRCQVASGFLALAAGDTARAAAVADSLIASRNANPWSAVLLVRLGRRSVQPR